MLDESERVEYKKLVEAFSDATNSGQTDRIELVFMYFLLPSISVSKQTYPFVVLHINYALLACNNLLPDG